MKDLKEKGPIFIVIAALLWSFDGILRRGLFTLPPGVIVFWEHVLGALILLPFIYKKLPEIKNITKREWGAITLVALFSGALGTILYTAALGKVNYIQFSVVVLLQQLQPIWAIITAAILLKEKITKRFIGWALLAIIASYLVTFKDLRVNLASGSGTAQAALFALLAGMMWATSTSFSKIVLQKVSHEIATFLRFLIAPVFAFLFVFLSRQTESITTISQDQWRSLLTITFTTGMVALLIYYYGLKKTQAKVSAICELTWPVSAIFIDYFYFKNSLSWTQWLGAVIVLFAIYRISSQQKK